MRLDDEQESQNVEDRRGSRLGTGLAGGGIGGVVILLIAMFFGIDPSAILQGGGGSESRVPEQTRQNEPAGVADEGREFVSRVLGSTERVWGEMFQKAGRQYTEPKLVLFTEQVRSACGFASAASGPFYCGNDQKVYIDLAFYRELRERFKAPGDFAQAYVIAHEVGHHVQNSLGIMDKVQARQQRASEREANALSVRLELQADCLAGIWASLANRDRKILEQGDVEEGLNAAAMIGDDTLQKRSQGYVVPEGFTHGSSQQRVRWFRTGLQTGDLKQCDTFSAGGVL
jgi:predicted metalloprotease